MTEHKSAPIFVVGSPRSGTSILTWCLGQHSNILAQEESDWIGPFAVNIGAHYATGSARGERSQLAALGVERAEFFRDFGDTINRMITGHRRNLEENSHASAQRDPRQVSSEFSVSRSGDEPKSRWVDGTPEYSFHICGLRKLFPDAKFVHIVRDVGAVVASLVNFRDDGGSPLVRSAEEAYDYWLRTAQACALAEQAAGGQVVYRVRYADLIQQPEPTLRGVFEFLGEPYEPACTAPMARRINSSRIDDDAKPIVVDDEADVIVRARQLSETLQQPWVAGPSSVGAQAQLDAAFDRRVNYFKDVDAKFQAARRMLAQLHVEQKDDTSWVQLQDIAIARLRKMLNWCGLLLALQLLPAIVVNLSSFATRASALWLVCALAGATAYAWLRRAGLLQLQRRVLGTRSAE